MSAVDWRTFQMVLHGILFPIAAVLVSVALAIGTGEIFLRVYKRDVAFQPDPDLIRSLRPHVERRIYSHDTEEALRAS